MNELKDKIYTFSVSNDDGSNRIEVTRTSGWEGLKPWEQLNMFKVLLLQASWPENLVKCIRIVDEGDLEYLSSEPTSILEEYR